MHATSEHDVSATRAVQLLLADLTTHKSPDGASAVTAPLPFQTVNIIFKGGVVASSVAVSGTDYTVRAAFKGLGRVYLSLAMSCCSDAETVF